jgi:hypothetical protein
MVPPTMMMAHRSSTLCNPVLIAFMLLVTILRTSCLSIHAFSISAPTISSTQRQSRSWSFLPNEPTTTTTPRSNVVVCSMSSSADDDGSSSPQRQGQGPMEEGHPDDYDTEETLLKIHLATQLGVSTQDALLAVAKYSQSFPFSAVLPLKPLMHMPTSDQGVEVKFLRNGADPEITDGGIRFFVKEVSVGAGGEKTTLTFSDDNDDEDDDDDSLEENESYSSSAAAAPAPSGGLDVTVKRNSVGQSTPHGVAERALVIAYLSGLTGGIGGGVYGSPPTEQVYVTSFFHKWMLL